MSCLVQPRRELSAEGVVTHGNFLFGLAQLPLSQKLLFSGSAETVRHPDMSSILPVGLPRSRAPAPAPVSPLCFHQQTDTSRNIARGATAEGTGLAGGLGCMAPLSDQSGLGKLGERTLVHAWSGRSAATTRRGEGGSGSALSGIVTEVGWEKVLFLGYEVVDGDGCGLF